MWTFEALLEPTYAGLPYILGLIGLCGVFFLSAFYNALVNWQARTLRLGTAREFLARRCGGRHSPCRWGRVSALAACETCCGSLWRASGRGSRWARFMPRVSWCMWGMNDEDEPVIGGPAPSFEDAMLRAELALRAHLGVKMDS